MLHIRSGLFRLEDTSSLLEVLLSKRQERDLSAACGPALTGLNISFTGTCTTSGSVT